MKIARFLRSSIAYLFAFSLIPLVLVVLLGMGGLTAVFVHGTGVTVASRFTGGAVVRVVDHGRWCTRIHEPVFESLLGRPSCGFVQIDWAPKKNVPVRIGEEIDYDGDGKPDFRVDWRSPSGVPSVQALSPQVEGVAEYYELAQSYSLRVNLRAHP